MSTVNAPPPPDPLSFEKLVKGGDKSDPQDEQIAALENSVLELNNARYEERFIWILIIIVLFDTLAFSHMENWSAPAVIGILELIGVAILADRCKVDAVAPLIDKVTGAIGRIKPGE